MLGNRKVFYLKQIILLIAVIMCISAPRSNYANSSTNQPDLDLFNELCNHVEEHFYDATFIHEKFPIIKKEYQSKIQTIASPKDFSALINKMLKQFNASHTYYLSPNDYEYYHLAAVFSLNESIQTLFHQQKITYPTIGIITKTLDNHVFIASVLSESTAEKAELLMGDEIVSINGCPYEPINSLKDQIGQQVTLTIKRTSTETPKTFVVTPTLVNPKLEMLEAERASIRVIETLKNRIGYIHIYSYAGEEYHQELISAISEGAFRNVDALIIDLRYGLGGADPSYLNTFNPQIPVISSTNNVNKTESYDPQWRKPTVFLVNGTVRSGKEILAFGARKYQLATVIGERTAGAVLGGSLFPLSNGDLLYLAGINITVDGEKLEGIGVAPDIEIPMDIRYCEGKDKQLKSAIDHLIRALGK